MIPMNVTDRTPCSLAGREVGVKAYIASVYRPPDVKQKTPQPLLIAANYRADLVCLEHATAAH